jgi:ParB family chromosome partitioning protein
LRLLGLPASVRRLVQDGALPHGHARALLALGDERAIADLARDVVAQGLTVREVERRVREAGGRRKPAPERAERGTEGTGGHRSADVRRMEDHLRSHFQTDVSIALTAKDRGEIRIAFYSTDDFERVLEVLGTRPE